MLVEVAVPHGGEALVASVLELGVVPVAPTSGAGQDVVHQAGVDGPVGVVHHVLEDFLDRRVIAFLLVELGAQDDRTCVCRAHAGVSGALLEDDDAQALVEGHEGGVGAGSAGAHNADVAVAGLLGIDLGGLLVEACQVGARLLKGLCDGGGDGCGGHGAAGHGVDVDGLLLDDVLLHALDGDLIVAGGVGAGGDNDRLDGGVAHSDLDFGGADGVGAAVADALDGVHLPLAPCAGAVGSGDHLLLDCCGVDVVGQRVGVGAGLLDAVGDGVLHSKGGEGGAGDAVDVHGLGLDDHLGG